MSPEGKTPKPVRRKAAGIGDNSSDDGYLDGQLLIAMPVMGDPRFERSVIYHVRAFLRRRDGHHRQPSGRQHRFSRPAGAARHHQEGRPDQAAGKRRDHEGAEGRPGRYRPRLRAAFQRFLHQGCDAATSTTDICLTATVDILKAIAQGRRAEARHPGARLCRLGAGAAGNRDPAQWLAALRRRSGPDLRRRCRGKIPARAAQDRHRSWHAVERSGARVARPDRHAPGQAGRPIVQPDDELGGRVELNTAVSDYGPLRSLAGTTACFYSAACCATVGCGAGDRGAAHVAGLRLVVAAHAVHGLAVVPHHEVMQRPFVDVDEFAAAWRAR